MAGVLDTTGRDLWRAIIANPEELDIRLRYADWCEENDDPDRAELIRVQVELTKFGSDDWQARYNAGTLAPDHPVIKAERTGRGCPVEALDAINKYNRTLMRLHGREKQLKESHPEWSRCECPDCGGSGDGKTKETFPTRIPGACPTCRGLRDLFRTVQGSEQAWDREIIVPRDLTWTAGFPSGVSCTVDECGRVETVRRHETRYSDSSLYDEKCIHCGATDARGSNALNEPCVTRTVFVPSAWALKLVGRVPLLTFDVTDRAPYHNGAGWCWFDCIRERAVATVPATAALLPLVFDALIEFDPKFENGRWKAYPTEQSARDAAGRAFARLARQGVTR